MKQKLSPAFFRLDLSGFVSNQWRVDLPETQSFEDCLDPTFWMHVTNKVTGENKAMPSGIGDEIVVFKRDIMAKRRYMIVGAGDGFIKLVESERFELPDTAELKEDSPLQVKWNPGRKGHEVVRIEAEGIKTVMAGPFQTRPEAVAWINDHMTKMAA